MKTKLNRKKKSNKRTKKVLKGGFTPEENIILNNNGLSNDQIQYLESLGATYDQISEKIQEIANRTDGIIVGNSDDVADMIVEEIHNEIMNQTIPDAQDDNHNMDIDDNDIVHDNSLHLSDLNVDSDVAFTDSESYDGGKRRRHKRTNKRKHLRKSRKQRRRTRKQRKYRGGKGLTDTITTEPYAYKEDEYNQQHNALNYH
jgi:hypothetical protein